MVYHLLSLVISKITVYILLFIYLESGRALNQVKLRLLELLLYFVARFILEVVVPSTKSSRTTSTCWNCYYILFVLSLGRAQVIS